METTNKKDDFCDTRLNKYVFYKTLRVSAWKSEFNNKCRKSERANPLRSAEIKVHLIFYVKSEQIKLVNSKQFHVVKILNCILKSKTESKLSALLFSCSVIRADRKNMQILIKKKKRVGS